MKISDSRASGPDENKRKKRFGEIVPGKGTITIKGTRRSLDISLVSDLRRQKPVAVEVKNIFPSFAVGRRKSADGNRTE
ncbi:hypothetical protein WN55_09491 [Dufourea novaeangliae]|uniref:Uncharacterized protein n=1 Tax=Dufourea novaeangliae TaxID=178035 RepID=A0A154NYP9_DUFNO|nr:hypothetical protein WN55_09491 [Dufourea novaeangliae]